MKEITSLFGNLGNTLYVQIWEKRIKVTDVKTSNVYDQAPLLVIERDEKEQPIIKAIGDQATSYNSPTAERINPFSHPRVLVADFTVAEKILQHSFRELLKANTLRPSPIVVIQPMEKLEGGLTMIEDRVLRELCFGAGARDVFVSTAKHQLSASEIDSITSEGSAKSVQLWAVIKWVVFLLIILSPFFFNLIDQA